MEPLTIPDLEDSVLSALKKRAALDGKSVEQEAAELIKLGLDVRQRNESLVERARRIAAMTPRDVEQTDSTTLIREDRDR